MKLFFFITFIFFISFSNGKSQVYFNFVGDIPFSNEAIPADTTEDSDSKLVMHVSNYKAYLLCTGIPEIRIVNLFSKEVMGTILLEEPASDFTIYDDEVFLLNQNHVTCHNLITGTSSIAFNFVPGDLGYSAINSTEDFISIYSPMSDSTMMFDRRHRDEDSKSVRSERGKMITDNMFVSSIVTQDSSVAVSIRDNNEITLKKIDLGLKINTLRVLGWWNNKITIYLEGTPNRSVEKENNRYLVNFDYDSADLIVLDSGSYFSDKIQYSKNYINNPIYSFNELFFIKENPDFFTVYLLSDTERPYLNLDLIISEKNPENELESNMIFTNGFKDIAPDESPLAHSKLISALESSRNFDKQNYAFTTSYFAAYSSDEIVNDYKLKEYIEGTFKSKSLQTDLKNLNLEDADFEDYEDIYINPLASEEILKLMDNLPDREIRERVIKTAYYYKDMEWEINASVKGNIDKYHLTTIDGKKIKVPNLSSGIYTGMPYAWGGSDNETQFRNKILKRNCVPGDICCDDDSGRPTVVAGMDCSGFVSVCYDLKDHYSTVALSQISTEHKKKNYNLMLPGDILDDFTPKKIDGNGRHVMIFLRRMGDMRFAVIDCAVDKSRGYKVNTKVFDQEQLKRYSPRYMNTKGITASAINN